MPDSVPGHDLTAAPDGIQISRKSIGNSARLSKPMRAQPRKNVRSGPAHPRRHHLNQPGGLQLPDRPGHTRHRRPRRRRHPRQRYRDLPGRPAQRRRRRHQPGTQMPENEPLDSPRTPAHTIKCCTATARQPRDPPQHLTIPAPAEQANGDGSALPPSAEPARGAPRACAQSAVGRGISTARRPTWAARYNCE